MGEDTEPLDTGNVEAYHAHGYIILAGRDTADGAYAAIEITKADALELMEWLSRATA